MLCTDVWINIFSFLSVPNLVHNARFVNKNWNDNVSNDILWKMLLERDYNQLDYNIYHKSNKELYIYFYNRYSWNFIRNACRVSNIAKHFYKRIRVLLVGDHQQGKQSIISNTEKYSSGGYTSRYIVLPIRVGNYDINVEVIYFVQILCSRYNRFISNSFNNFINNCYGFVGVIIPFNISNSNSFHRVEKWERGILKNTKIPFLLLGMKLGDEQQSLDLKRKAIEFASKHSMAYLELDSSDPDCFLLPFYFFAMCSEGKIMKEEMKLFTMRRMD